MARVVWTEPALQDLKDIIRYIAKDSPAHASAFGTRLVEAPRQLEPFPQLGREVPEFGDPTIRELLCGVYRIIYVMQENCCYITAVVHGSRDLLRRADPDEGAIS